MESVIGAIATLLGLSEKVADSLIQAGKLIKAGISLTSKSAYHSAFTLSLLGLLLTVISIPVHEWAKVGLDLGILLISAYAFRTMIKELEKPPMSIIDLITGVTTNSEKLAATISLSVTIAKLLVDAYEADKEG